MSDAAFVLGGLLSALVPAGVTGWLVLRWTRGRAGVALAVVLALGAAWLAFGAFVGWALSDWSVAMD